ncbi:hypothetical protein ABG768_026236, partial [Culter alburnus]
METARLRLIRMALDSGELERRDEKVPLEVNVHEDGDEVTLTLFNRDGKAPIAFLTHMQEPSTTKYDPNGPERVLAAVTKRLLQLKAVAKEQPIIISSMAGELARLKKNLVMNMAVIHAHRWDQWNLVLGDNQLEWCMIKMKRKEKMTKYHDKHQHLPKYFTDGSERAGKVKWGYLVKKDGQLITSQCQEIEGTAQLAEVMAVVKALEKAVELGHKEDDLSKNVNDWIKASKILNPEGEFVLLTTVKDRYISYGRREYIEKENNYATSIGSVLNDTLPWLWTAKMNLPRAKYNKEKETWEIDDR